MIKKILAVALTGVMMLAMSVSVFAAGNINENEKKILERLETIKCPEKYLNQAINFMENDNIDITALQAEGISVHIDAVRKVVSSAGIHDPDELRNDLNVKTLNKVVEEARAAADLIDYILTYDRQNDIIKIEPKPGQDSKPVIIIDNNEIKNTGADPTSVNVVVTILGLGVAVLAVVTKKNAEA